MAVSLRRRLQLRSFGVRVGLEIQPHGTSAMFVGYRILAGPLGQLQQHPVNARLLIGVRHGGTNRQGATQALAGRVQVVAVQVSLGQSLEAYRYQVLVGQILAQLKGGPKALQRGDVLAHAQEGGADADQTVDLVPTVVDRLLSAQSPPEMVQSGVTVT